MEQDDIKKAEKAYIKRTMRLINDYQRVNEGLTACDVLTTHREAFNLWVAKQSLAKLNAKEEGV